MLDLQPLIARFVDDVLRTIRGASLDELRRHLGPEASGAPAPARRIAPPPARRIAPAAPRQASGGARRRPAPEARAPSGLNGAPRAQSVAPAREAPEPPTLSEITDPEALLAAAFAPPVAPTPGEPARVIPEVEPPASEERVKGSATALRAGETLLRDAGAGVVIRRAKRA
jgi:hypothetical protein